MPRNLAVISCKTMSALIAVILVFAGLQAGGADPPKGQTYDGSKKCASCHFKQYMTWKKDKHSKSFSLLPASYQKNAKCLKCHTTGFGEPSGFKDIKTTPNLAGTTCETCHGPGSEHSKIAEKFGKKKLTAAEEKTVRDSIWLMTPKNVCIECHKTKAHGKSETPAELKKK